MKSPAELAHRIETGVETKSGRYDWASKVEVRAYVKREIAKIEGLGEDNRLDILTLQKRIDELELSWWRRLKRAIGKVRT